MSDAILSALSRLEAGQSALQSGQDDLRAEMAAFRAGITDELAATRGALMDRMDGHANQLTEIRDDIAVNMGGVDAARHANENTRADVMQMREQLSVMWKQIKMLQTKVRDITGDP